MIYWFVLGPVLEDTDATQPYNDANAYDAGPLVETTA